MTKQRSQQKITNKPAPYVPGLYSVQAVSLTKGLPDVTIYRESASEALSWKTESAKRGLFDKFMLRHSIDAWDVYDSDGKLEHLCNSVAYPEEPDKSATVNVEISKLEEEAMKAIGKKHTLVVSAESHSGSSAASHANFLTMTAKMIHDADHEDLRHVHVVSSSSWPCRVSALFLDVTEASSGMQDAFLDRYKKLSAGQALDVELHKKVIASRMAVLKASQLADIYRDASITAGATEDDALSVKMVILTALSSAEKLHLAQVVMRTCYDAVKIRKGCEVFDKKEMEKHSKALLKAYASAGDAKIK